MNEPSNATPSKEHAHVPDGQAGHQPAATGLYLLFAHEPYYPLPAREINTSVVAAACLLHPQVRQPDGMRIHQRLACGRRQGEIVPLATLTHELDGGAHWPAVGDWEAVTAGLVRLIRGKRCDALSLGLPPSSAPCCAAAPTPRSASSTRPPRNAPPTARRTERSSWPRYASTSPGPRQAGPCVPATACSTRQGTHRETVLCTAAHGQVPVCGAGPRPPRSRRPGRPGGHQAETGAWSR